MVNNYQPANYIFQLNLDFLPKYNKWAKSKGYKETSYPDVKEKLTFMLNHLKYSFDRYKSLNNIDHLHFLLRCNVDLGFLVPLLCKQYPEAPTELVEMLTSGQHSFETMKFRVEDYTYSREGKNPRAIDYDALKLKPASVEEEMFPDAAKKPKLSVEPIQFEEINNIEIISVHGEDELIEVIEPQYIDNDGKVYAEMTNVVDNVIHNAMTEMVGEFAKKLNHEQAARASQKLSIFLHKLAGEIGVAYED